jgi:hypothetical protein
MRICAGETLSRHMEYEVSYEIIDNGLAIVYGSVFRWA